MKQESLRAVVGDFGKKYSEMLSIDLSGGDDREIFRWFLASLLFGAPITESSAIKTYSAFKRHGVLTPKDH